MNIGVILIVVSILFTSILAYFWKDFDRLYSRFIRYKSKDEDNIVKYILLAVFIMIFIIGLFLILFSIKRRRDQGQMLSEMLDVFTSGDTNQIRSACMARQPLKCLNEQLHGEAYDDVCDPLLEFGQRVRKNGCNIEKIIF